jgi:hypothetical protein
MKAGGGIWRGGFEKVTIFIHRRSIFKFHIHDEIGRIEATVHAFLFRPDEDALMEIEDLDVPTRRCRSGVDPHTAINEGRTHILSHCCRACKVFRLEGTIVANPRSKEVCSVRESVNSFQGHENSSLTMPRGQPASTGVDIERCCIVTSCESEGRISPEPVGKPLPDPNEHLLGVPVLRSGQVHQDKSAH